MPVDTKMRMAVPIPTVTMADRAQSLPKLPVLALSDRYSGFD